MAAAYLARFLEENEFERWNKFVASCPAGSIYSSADYLDILCRNAGGSFRILAAFSGDELACGLALYERKTLNRTYVSPRLLLYYNGLVCREHTSRYPSQNCSKEIALLSALYEKLFTQKYAAFSLRNRSPITDVRPWIAKGWRATVSYSYEVSLSDMEAQWAKVDQNLRRLINRCAKQDFTVTEDDDFDSFYELHKQTYLRKGVEIYLPYGNFKQYFKELREHNLCRMFHARLPDGKVVSSQLVLLGSHPVTHTVCAAAAEEYLATGVTAFLRWRVFERIAELGYRANDLTDAALNPVTKFKSQLGGDLRMSVIISQPASPLFQLNRSIRDSIKQNKTRVARQIRKRWAHYSHG